MESAAQIDQSGGIQVQSRHGGPACCGMSFDKQEIRAPGKMARPALAAWVEQWDRSPCLGIDSVCLGVFVTVTCGARPGQFIDGTARTAHPRNDVFADEWSTREVGRMLTVFAAIAGAVAYLSADCPRNSFMCHPRRLCDQAPPSRLAGIDPGGEPIAPMLRSVQHRSAGPLGPGTGNRPVLAASVGRARSEQ